MNFEYNSGISTALQLATVAGALVLALHGTSMLPAEPVAADVAGAGAPTASCTSTQAEAQDQAARRNDGVQMPTLLTGRRNAEVGVAGASAALTDSDAVDPADVAAGSAANDQQDDTAASGKIQYDSGLPVPHRSLAQMFATLASPGQPGSIRAQLMRDAGIPGRWVAAGRAHYILHADQNGGEPQIAAYADRDQADDCGRASGGGLLNYQQVLAQSHYSPTSRQSSPTSH
ncbi:nitrous oxide reductase accessory protein NosL [Rugamonas sp. DEMB1]|uniref:nitrous oxide reductase accessory protein NosL n=1 Tax=Rugamonas sp. DEMB1 TaxID=3039386 RepID=UPI00244AC45B|nr:nitrous oxide reductase accessory protein NosL [Rugamonas sp. DEMB1]WGG52809.1 nitrous oxide reductase accessory protein NosL [Rugamonas sp. DEMB1]